jgi:hypothetical protein
MSDWIRGIIEWPFWADFWPTVMGVILGIPAALWLDRRTQRRAEKQQRDERADRLAEVARLLRDSVRSNGAALRELAQTEATNVEAISEIELASWEALHDEAFDLIPSMELRRDLARHFERVARISSMNERRTQRIAERLNQPIYGEDRAAPFEAGWLQLLKKEAAEASEEAGKLASRLEKFD